MLRYLNIRQSISSKNLPKRSNGDQYYYVKDFEQANEKKCKKLDKLNYLIYEKNLDIFNRTNKKLQDTPLKIENKPIPPPKPNNYENLLLFRQRNVFKSVNDQTLAVLFLLSRGFQFKFDKNPNGIEPYLALDIMEKIIRQGKEDVDIFLEIKEFQNKLLNNQKNIFKINNDNNVEDINIKKSPSNNSLKDNENLIFFTKTLRELNNTVSIENNKISDNKVDNKISKINILNILQRKNSNNKFECSNPEHHNIDEKICHYEENILDKNKCNFPIPSAPPSYNDVGLQIKVDKYK